ncbi:MAG: lysophospholipid acyltransferase family protein [Prevotellaceae bacterium]|nr:lysophospholipid acyltransferase family protein [Prevotellaceae bacterium]
MAASKLTYKLIYACIWLLAGLPFAVLHLLSDLICPLIHHVVRYRLRVVRENLRRSFPEKTKRELRRIERRFYHYLCDYMLEQLKLLRLSHEEFFRHMEFPNKELCLSKVKECGGVLLLVPHYANFEWTMGITYFLDPKDYLMQVYKPLHNHSLDDIFLKIRSRFGTKMVPKHSVAREMIQLARSGKRAVIGLVTDQSPKPNEAHHWTTFLNQETSFMDGAERIAKKFGFAVCYCELERVRRGYCKVWFDLMTDNPKATADGEITEMFARRLEKTIRREPAYWLWSHRRWKLKKADVERYHKEESDTRSAHTPPMNDTKTTGTRHG